MSFFGREKNVVFFDISILKTTKCEYSGKAKARIKMLSIQMFILEPDEYNNIRMWNIR